MYQNSKWPFIHWSWDDVHLPKDAHTDREILDSFLHWLDLKASGLSNQIHFNKNQLQELLLRIALFLRDLELSCFADHEEVSMPDHIANSCMEAADIDAMTRVLQTLSKAIKDHLE